MAGLISPDDDSAKITFPPPLIYLGTLALGVLADRLLGFSWPLAIELRIGALAVLVLAGLALLVAAANHFVLAGTEVKPWKTSSAIVGQGVYRFTRNPMYLGMALIYLGLALGLASIAALALLPVALLLVQSQVIAREERYLEAKFGEEYRRYKASVRRWL
jgi:protein-S-isoprenylcysteine O-methyltransferase Ste14